MTSVETDKIFTVAVFSFGFKYGLPEDATTVFDVRFLPNPYWEEEMRPFTGRDGRVAAYVLESDAGREFMARLLPMLQFCIAQNRLAGKAEMRIAVGCTGGQHRSVAVVERLGMLLRDQVADLRIFHRDIEKE